MTTNGATVAAHRERVPSRTLCAPPVADPNELARVHRLAELWRRGAHGPEPV